MTMARAHLDLKKNGAKWSFDYRTPESVLPGVASKEDLVHSLNYHSNPHIKMHTPDSPEARRYHVEKTRPALRWFCKKFGVNAPAWLEGNMHYDEIEPELFKELFGEGPFNVREFEERQTQQAGGGGDGAK